MSNRKIVSSNIKNTTVKVPGSKYLANRYIALAALANGVTELKNTPINDDITAALKAIESLGAKVNISDDIINIQGIANFEQEEIPTINCKDSGTLSRFITALAANLSSSVIIDASEQMRQRPMQEIVESLQALQVSVDSENGFLPITLQGPIAGGVCSLDASRSSQFLSALLIACLKAKQPTEIQLQGELVSESYVELTLKAITLFAGKVQGSGSQRFVIPANQKLVAPIINVASDVVSCSYFMAAALIGETSITIENYDFDSVQGEANFPSVLQKMGAKISQNNDDLQIVYTQPLHGITVDMGNMPDAVPTLAVIAAFAQGATHITNIAHLAFKESNRIVDLCEQLKKVGVDCEYGEDYIKIHGQHPALNLKANVVSSCHVSSCHDHRLAMSLALFGIKLPELIIQDAHAVEKSFPKYWEYLEQIGIVTEEV